MHPYAICITAALIYQTSVSKKVFHWSTSFLLIERYSFIFEKQTELGDFGKLLATH